jgi:chemotaxis protein methyltransferase CheR
MAATAAPAPATSLHVNDAAFRGFQRLIYEEAGIHLNDSKRALLAGRLGRRWRELGLRSLGDYRRYVEAHPDERTEVLDRVTTNETRFFREPHQFELLERRLIPEWRVEAEAGRRPRLIRAWSAGCSTGEEPFSLAMTLLSHCPWEEGWEIDVLATDISSRVLRRALEAVFSTERVREIPPPFLRRFMLRGVRTQDGCVKAAPELRAAVRFERRNLLEARRPDGGPFDLILCRNVLIYFDAASKARVLTNLLDRLGPDGVLFLGHAESLGRTDPVMRALAPNTYRRARTA